MKNQILLWALVTILAGLAFADQNQSAQPMNAKWIKCSCQNLQTGVKYWAYGTQGFDNEAHVLGEAFHKCLSFKRHGQSCGYTFCEH